MNVYTGDNFDDFLAEEGILEEVSMRAEERLLAIQAKEIIVDRQIAQSKLADRLQTDRSQENVTVKWIPN